MPCQCGRTLDVGNKPVSPPLYMSGYVNGPFLGSSVLLSKLPGSICICGGKWDPLFTPTPGNSRLALTLSLTHSQRKYRDPLFSYELQRPTPHGRALTMTEATAAGLTHSSREGLQRGNAPSPCEFQMPNRCLLGTWDISGDMGLVSAGRINKDTPPLTTPSHTSKSSAMDISSHTF